MVAGRVCVSKTPRHWRMEANDRPTPGMSVRRRANSGAGVACQVPGRPDSRATSCNATVSNKSGLGSQLSDVCRSGIKWIVLWRDTTPHRLRIELTLPMTQPAIMI